MSLKSLGLLGLHVIISAELLSRKAPCYGCLTALFQPSSGCVNLLRVAYVLTASGVKIQTRHPARMAHFLTMLCGSTAGFEATRVARAGIIRRLPSHGQGLGWNSSWLAQQLLTRGPNPYTWPTLWLRLLKCDGWVWERKSQVPEIGAECSWRAKGKLHGLLHSDLPSEVWASFSSVLWSASAVSLPRFKVRSFEASLDGSSGKI